MSFVIDIKPFKIAALPDGQRLLRAPPVEPHGARAGRMLLLRDAGVARVPERRVR